MAWEEQGRQYHGWFGTGITGVDTAAGSQDSFESRAFTVIRNAASFMPRGLAREYQAFVSRGSGESTLQAMDAWRTAADLPSNEFHRLVAGPDMSRAAVASLQAMAREMEPFGDMEAAGRHLAAAVMDGSRDNAIYRFAGAQYQAVYAEANGLLPDSATPPALEADKPIVLAAGGDLKCDGFSAGCQSGGSWGTSASHFVLGRNLCRSCAVKMLGVEGEPISVQNGTLRRFEIIGR